MRKIEIKNVDVSDNDISVNYEISEDLKKYFNLDNKFSIHYYENINSVPKSVAIIPFVSNVLPIVWMTDSVLLVDELDRAYYNSILKTREAFRAEYSDELFKGDIIVKNLIDTKPLKKANKESVFYSGGVDSTYSLISLLKKGIKPFLITLWGSDVWDSNEDGWNSLKENAIISGRQFELKNLFIKSNFRKFIIEQNLTELLNRRGINTSWWYGIQHGIGLIGHVAPYSYLYNITLHSIPATLNSKKDGGKCASCPRIDESVEFLNCKISHNGYDLTRLDKVEKIVEYFKSINENFKLRVCYMDKGEKLNCCKCEKCMRTIMELVSIKESPADWGFDCSDEEIKKFPFYLVKNKCVSTDLNKSLWKDIKLKALVNKDYIKRNTNYRWILHFENPIKKIFYKYFE